MLEHNGFTPVGNIQLPSPGENLIGTEGVASFHITHTHTLTHTKPNMIVGNILDVQSDFSLIIELLWGLSSLLSLN